MTPQQQPIPDILHRYTDHHGVVLKNSYYVVRRTPHGAWVRTAPGKKKFILDSAKKRFAIADLEEAKTSFLARKRRQLAILRAQITGIETAVTAIQEGRLGDYHHVDFYFDN